MKHTSFLSLVLLIVGSTQFMCGKKKSVEQEPVAVIGSDTIKAGELVAECPDTGLDKASEIRCKVLMLSLSRQAVPPADTASFHQAVDDISEQISLRSGNKWDSAQTASVLNAARAMQTKLDAAEEASDVARYIDSLFSSISVIGSADSARSDFSSMLLDGGLDGSPVSKRMALTALLSRTFGLEAEIADIFADYASIETSKPKDTTAISSIVKGLVYDESKEKLDKAVQPKLKHRVRDNSEFALRYRPRASILDSISRHHVYLEALYKRKLKIHTNMAGTVVVSFRVGPSGTVLSSKIVRSEIREKEFLDPFAEYVKTIRFKPIPENVGPMTFEFPFEFKSR